MSGISWHFFSGGGHALLHTAGLHLYAVHPELQTGPLALLVAALLGVLPPAAGRAVALVLMTAAGPLLVAALAPLVDGRRRGPRLLLAAVVLVPAWTVLAVRWGHLDDVLAMAGGVLAVRAVCARRPPAAGLALGAALAAKPWAVGFLPLLLALPRGRLRGLGAAASVAAAAWLPFLVAEPRTLDALHPPVALTPASGLHTLGARGRVVPSWGRTAQLLLSPAVALVVALAGRWPGVLLVSVAVRLALDPQDNGYYVASAALAAVVFDLLGTPWTVPWTTLGTVVFLWQPFVRDYPHRFTSTTGVSHWWFTHQTTVGALHLCWAVLVVALVLAVPRPEPAGSVPPG